MTMEYLERDKAQIKLTNLPILIGSKARNRLVDMAYSISAYLKRRRQQKIDRAAFNNMLLLDDNILKDIGVAHGDVVWASRLPLSQNAALELNKIAHENKLMRL